VATKEAKETPIINMDGVSFIHTTQGDITLVATTKSNCNAALIMEFLYQLITLCKAYFGGEFDETQIRKNFVLIYELMDEIMDYGYPQITDADLLKLYITQGKINPDLTNIEKLKQITIQATGAISWRGDNVRYKKNEVFIDIIENVNVLLSNRGTVLRSDVVGQVVMKALLSGMPECKFGINDKLLIKAQSATQNKQVTSDRGISIDDIKFHQCVRLGRFDRDRSITFIPPDGVFEVMTYRITENINLPFKIMPVVQEYPDKIEVSLKIKAIFDRSNFASNVVIKIPVPKNTATINFYSAAGKAKYEPDQNAGVWRIKKFPGETEYFLRADVRLAQSKTEKQWSRPPISMDFQVPMFTASGLRVRFLRVHEKGDYKPTKWIRYLSKAGEYQHRI